MIVHLTAVKTTTANQLSVTLISALLGLGGCATEVCEHEECDESGDTTEEAKTVDAPKTQTKIVPKTRGGQRLGPGRGSN